MRVRQFRRRLFRITLVVAVGAGLAALAASPERQKTVDAGKAVADHFD